VAMALAVAGKRRGGGKGQTRGRDKREQRKDFAHRSYSLLGPWRTTTRLPEPLWLTTAPLPLPDWASSVALQAPPCVTSASAEAPLWSMTSFDPSPDCTASAA